MMKNVFVKVISLIAVMTSSYVSQGSAQTSVQNLPGDLPAKYMKLIRHYNQKGKYQKALASVNQEGIGIGHSFALIAGITFYPNMPKSSRYLRPAEVDLSRLESYLREQEFFDEIVVLKDEDFTYDNLSYFLGTYFPKQLNLSPGSRFLFAYSGHGYSETQGKRIKGYIITSSASSTKDSVNRIDLSVLKTLLSGVVDAAEHTLVLINSCQSGAFIGKAQGSAAVNGHSAKAIVASRTDQSSFQLADVGPGSVFFEKIFSGLAGSADKSPKDGVITFDELLTYLKEQIPNATGDNQIPKEGELDPDGSDGEFYFLNRGIQLGAGNVKPWNLGKPDAFDDSASDIYQEGLIAFKSGEYEDAFEHFMHAATKGNVEAMVYVGSYYEQGLVMGFPQNPPSGPTLSKEEQAKYWETRKRERGLSREWYKRAAEHGNPTAMYHLAHIYEVGEEQDLKMALCWYEQAADNGSIFAAYNLGMMYEEGRGVTRDFSKAQSYYETAAIAGVDLAMVELAKSYEAGATGKKDPELAVYWYRQASEVGNGEAMKALGLAYARGKLGLGQDFNEAERWFLRDSSSGTFRPFSFPLNIWELEERGDEGGVRDYPDAKAHYERWARQGNKMSMANLGFLYLNGLGVKKDVPKAMDFFEQGANGGNAYALYNLGALYEKGDDGVPPDMEKAIEFYQKADAVGNYEATTALQRLGRLKTAR